MKKTMITNICLVALSVLAMVFLALPIAGRTTGYDCFQLLGYLGEMNFGSMLLFLSPLFILIASIALLVFSVLTLLVNLNVIKNEKLLKVARVINLVAGIVMGAFAVLAFILLLVEGGSPAVGIILLLLAGIAAAVVAILEKVWSKK